MRNDAIGADREVGGVSTDADETLTVDRVVMCGERVRLRPAEDIELTSLAEQIADDAFARPWWGVDAQVIRAWLVDPESTVFVIEVDGGIAGVIMYAEETDPYYRHASIDVTLTESHIGKGLGAEALTLLARYLFQERHHHRITIDPAASNARAIRAYTKVGFRPVGVMRQYELSPEGEWRDGLLMDLLADDMDI